MLDYENMSAKELKELAKSFNVVGYSNMNKADLVAAVSYSSAELTTDKPVVSSGRKTTEDDIATQKLIEHFTDTVIDQWKGRPVLHLDAIKPGSGIMFTDNDMVYELDEINQGTFLLRPIAKA